MKRSAQRPGMGVDVELMSERNLRAKKGKGDNLFAWSVFLLLLIGVVMACWIGSFYVFQHPENPRSYEILRRLKKIDPPKRYAPTLAPNGKFYHAKDFLKFVGAKSEADLAKMNLELLQAYIGNYDIKELEVPYLAGRFSILRSQILSKSDLITSGYIALARSVDDPKLLVEQLYPAESQYTDDLRQMLQPGVEIKLERTYDLSAVLHAEKLSSGIWQVTVVPLNYDSYGLGDGREVRLSPPLKPNLDGYLPVMDLHSGNELSRTAIADASPNRSQSPGQDDQEKEVLILSRSGPTPDQSITRVAKALPVTKTLKPEPEPAAESTVTPMKNLVTAVPSPSATPEVTPSATPKKIVASSAVPAPKAAANWQTYAPGQMPRGPLLDVPELDGLAKKGGPQEVTYLRGNFTVKANDGNRAVMRASNRLVNAIGLGNAVQGQTRIIVEYPEGQTAPKVGAQISRDRDRPFQITAIRRDAKGQINVFVREVTAP